MVLANSKIFLLLRSSKITYCKNNRIEYSKKLIKLETIIFLKYIEKI